MLCLLFISVWVVRYHLSLRCYSVATALTFSREDWFSLLLLVLCKVPLHFNNNVHTSVMVTLQRSNVQKLTRPQNWKIQLNILALTDTVVTNRCVVFYTIAYYHTGYWYSKTTEICPYSVNAHTTITVTSSRQKHCRQRWLAVTLQKCYLQCGPHWCVDSCKAIFSVASHLWLVVAQSGQW